MTIFKEWLRGAEAGILDVNHMLLHLTYPTFLSHITGQFGHILHLLTAGFCQQTYPRQKGFSSRSVEQFGAAESHTGNCKSYFQNNIPKYFN